MCILTTYKEMKIWEKTLISCICIILFMLPSFTMINAANNSAFKYQKSIKKWENDSDDLRIWLNHVKNHEYPHICSKAKGATQVETKHEFSRMSQIKDLS